MFLKLKILLLLAAASGRRVSCLNALAVNEGYIRWNKGNVSIHFPEFLAKKDSYLTRQTRLHCLKMSTLSSFTEDNLLCPVYALNLNKSLIL